MEARFGCTRLSDGRPIHKNIISYTGTWLKTETEGRAIGLSDAELAERMTVEQVIDLATALGCAQ